MFDSEGDGIQLTSSFGVCAATSAGEKPEALLVPADELPYRSKREGQNHMSA